MKGATLSGMYKNKFYIRNEKRSRKVLVCFSLYYKRGMHNFYHNFCETNLSVHIIR